MVKLDGEAGVVAQFLLDCRSRHLSNWTLTFYNRVLRLLVRLLNEVCDIAELEQVTVLHLRQCVDHLFHTAPYLYGRAHPGRVQQGRTLAAQSVYDYVLVWKTFFNWCYQEELVDKNPVDRLKLPVLEKRIKTTLTPEEVQLMLDSCDTSTVVGFRDYVILSLLVDSGLRLAEIAGLRLEDVQGGYIRVHQGKGRRQREVGLHPEVAKLIWKYIQRYRHSRVSGETALFLSRWGKPLSRYGVTQLIKRIKQHCGFEGRKITPHVFRHTFSKQYMARGGDLLSLSRELGHSDIQVTRLYLQDFGSEDARKDHDARSIFNEIKVSKRKKSGGRRKERDF